MAGMTEESDGSCVALRMKRGGREEQRERERDKWMEKMREESVSETQSKARLYFNRGKLDRALKRAVNGARVLITKRWTLSAVPTIRPEISARGYITPPSRYWIRGKILLPLTTFDSNWPAARTRRPSIREGGGQACFDAPR